MPSTGISLFRGAAGAILRYAVTTTAQRVNLKWSGDLHGRWRTRKSVVVPVLKAIEGRGNQNRPADDEDRPVPRSMSVDDPEMTFAVDVTSIEGETVLTLHGELDLWTQPRFVAAIAGLDDSVARVVLDLSDLTFIDCGNIGTIQRARVFAGLRGTAFVLWSPNPQLRRIMELTGLWPSTGDDAVRSIVVPSPPARTSTQRSPA